MFFTPELLSKRDNGFGLLWLAATLGSRSSFKKLPKRSVLTADIAQLCDLISEPEEPLALRLSSNLMFGVVRVYKVKQEIFLSDVTNCVTSLKKVVQELRGVGPLNEQLQMANPVARISAVTIAPDPKAIYALDYDAFVADWDKYLNIGVHSFQGNDSLTLDDPDYNPNDKVKKPFLKSVPHVEGLRKEAHTLDENHEHLLSASFDQSFNINSGKGDDHPSSSQVEAAFDNFFPFSDGLDLGDGLGEDLLQEIGWNTSPVKSVQNYRTDDLDPTQLNLLNEEPNEEPNIDADFQLNQMALGGESPVPVSRDETPPLRTKTKYPRKKENIFPPSRAASVLQVPPSPTISFSRLLLSQDIEQPQPLRDVTKEGLNRQNQENPLKKPKRTRLLLDARTELTDAELKVARAKYIESQNRIRQEMLSKKNEKDSGKIIEDLIWGVPKEIQAQGLINFWQENFRVQVEARTGCLRIHHEEDEPPVKRRKTASTQLERDGGGDFQNLNDNAMNTDVDWYADQLNAQADVAMIIDDPGDIHSSGEPGQARRRSRSGSLVGASNLGFDLDPRDSVNGSQKSSLFPWDNAGPSSSTGNAPFMPDGDHPVERVDYHLRSSSVSRRESPTVNGSHKGAITGVPSSPAPIARSSQIFGEDFVFDLENAAVLEDTQQETQKSDHNMIALERNSYNFLEYAKMQCQSLPDGRLSFEIVVPGSTSTRHVASAAFYHCLVLATKNLLRVGQHHAYGPIFIDPIN